MFDEAGDFDDIIEYTDRVTHNVIKSICAGVFENHNQRRLQIPNLMEVEDQFLFGDETCPEKWERTVSSSKDGDDRFNEESILKTSENNTNQISAQR